MYTVVLKSFCIWEKYINSKNLLINGVDDRDHAQESVADSDGISCSGERKMAKPEQKQPQQDDMTEAKVGDVIKLENAGDKLEGIYISHELSKKFADSFAVHLRVGEDIKVLFASQILVDLIVKNGIQNGDKVRIVYEGKKQNEAKTFSYHNYKLFYKKAN